MGPPTPCIAGARRGSNAASDGSAGGGGLVTEAGGLGFGGEGAIAPFGDGQALETLGFGFDRFGQGGVGEAGVEGADIALVIGVELALGSLGLHALELGNR